MSDEKLMMKPITGNNGQINLPISESELLDGLKAYNAHADEIAELSHKEMDALGCDQNSNVTGVVSSRQFDNCQQLHDGQVSERIDRTMAANRPKPSFIG